MTRSTSISRRHALAAALAMAATALTFSNCSSSTEPDESGTFFGPTTAMGSGTARSYATLDRQGQPTELGVALSEAALTGLPAVTTEFVLELPGEASETPFQHAVIDWQPLGHPPPMVYTVPHFDVHFYMITPAERAAIVLGDANLAARMVQPPAAEFIPVDYVTGMSSVRMGMHWNDPKSPERNGQPFTHTFIYGSYAGRFIFSEPMVAKSYLETKPAAIVTPIKLPAQYATPGYQPVAYLVGYDTSAREYRIALTGLVKR